jgi:hypothetical protein
MNALVDGLDRVRLGWLQLLGPLASPFVRSRELRSASALGLSIVLALVLTAVAPLELLALGPLVLGVPHLAADVRYLVVRPGLHRRPAFWVAVVAPLLALGLTSTSWLGFVAMLGAVLTLPSVWTARRIVMAVVAAALLVASFTLPRVIAPVIAHAHNLIAVGFFLAWPHLVSRERTSGWHRAATMLFVLASIAIFAGALDTLALDAGRLEVGEGMGTNVDVHLATLVPSSLLEVEHALALRFVLFFAFAQSVHYATWLRAIPDEDRERETPRTFRASLEAMRLEGSLPVMVVFGMLALGLGVWAAIDLYDARMGYLRGALFHGYLELAVIGALFAQSGAGASRLRDLGSAA